MTTDPTRFVVFTGGPGSGKTTLLRALAERGFETMPEAGRAIIQDQVAIGGAALPWADRAAFAELMLAWELRSYRVADSRRRPVLFDRGVPDVIGYLRLCGLPVPNHVEAAARLYRYAPLVFVAPPWRDIFTGDEERRQDFDEGVRTYETMVETYREFRYDLAELPRTSVTDRVRFVEDRIGPPAAGFTAPRR